MDESTSHFKRARERRRNKLSHRHDHKNTNFLSILSDDKSIRHSFACSSLSLSLSRCFSVRFVFSSCYYSVVFKLNYMAIYHRLSHMCVLRWIRIGRVQRVNSSSKSIHVQISTSRVEKERKRNVQLTALVAHPNSMFL
jgi:hypothetical protein